MRGLRDRDLEDHGVGATPLPGAGSNAADWIFLPMAPATTVSVIRASSMSLSARRSNASLRAASTTCRWYVRLSFFCFDMTLAAVNGRT